MPNEQKILDKSRTILIWDGAVRLFHWSIVLLVLACWISAENGMMDLHILCGLAVLGLLIFRIIWGFIGSPTARFAQFLRGPRAVIGHLRWLIRGGQHGQSLGHNPLGGWAVMALLGLMGVQALTGLGSYDMIFSVGGPLAPHLPEEWSDRLTAWHHQNFDLLMAMIGVHVAAIIVYRLLRRQDLLTPMLTGRKKQIDNAPELGIRPPSPWLAAGLLAVSLAASYSLLALAG
ncbi:MAG: cytochrome b/b6 domain-containing protein [Alphaproteobacteria bacterium]|nr:MAG: cytochrome b/b6 domain-containing protein [Alphaproteobacteria bacterium]